MWILLCEFYFNKNLKDTGGFPGDSVVKNLPANAGDTGSIPGPGKSHMPQGNLSLCVCHNYWACALESMPTREATSMKTHLYEKPAHHN